MSNFADGYRWGVLQAQLATKAHLDAAPRHVLLHLVRALSNDEPAGAQAIRDLIADAWDAFHCHGGLDEDELCTNCGMVGGSDD